jgi:alkylation response protein AidB-like acyl-CoA dehydrogenase
MMSIAEDRLENIRMLRESASAVADRSDLMRIRKLRFTPQGFDRAVWRQMAELGWLGLRMPEQRGGSGLGMLELCSLVEELGAALVPEPLIAGTLAAQLLQDEPLDAMLEGVSIYLPAWQEKAQCLEYEYRTTFVDGVVNGRKVFVGAANAADGFVVATMQGLALVSSREPGLTIKPVMLQDGGYSCELLFGNVAAQRLSGEFVDALDDAVLATAAYLLGMIEATLARTLEYLHTRKQFGVPIGTFQALQHAAVDMKLQAALSRASVERAAALVDAGAAAAERRAAISRAKARASEAAILVTKQAVQLHGGIGYSDEHDIGLFLRKAMVLAPAYGNAALHRKRYARFAIDRDIRKSAAAGASRLA